MVFRENLKLLLWKLSCTVLIEPDCQNGDDQPVFIYQGRKTYIQQFLILFTFWKIYKLNCLQYQNSNSNMVWTNSDQTYIHGSGSKIFIHCPSMECVCGMMDSGLEIGELISNCSQVHDIHLCANILRKGMNPISPP